MSRVTCRAIDAETKAPFHDDDNDNDDNVNEEQAVEEDKEGGEEDDLGTPEVRGDLVLLFLFLFSLLVFSGECAISCRCL
mmetsp:Transcript_3941/g.7923  ORF Transcript_3941/g.7923 Transcript_3941/m.7923 type:complete len:80 (-) Transcript_3941:25-264(-)